MKNMENPSTSLWNAFLNSLEKTIRSSNTEILRKLDTYNQRKYIWKHDFLPEIANELGLLYDDSKEFLKIDYTYFKKGAAHDWKVPKICIESENNWDSSYEEILKLCRLC